MLDMHAVVKAQPLRGPAHRAVVPRVRAEEVVQEAADDDDIEWLCLDVVRDEPVQRAPLCERCAARYEHGAVRR
jgi:hypothetical protein